MKERLTGAIIVVALLVLLVPELLTGPESWTPAKPAVAEGAQLRSYTIDLQADAANRQPSPPTAPTTAVPEQPVAQATPETEAESPPVASVSPPVDEATRATGRPMGSGADSSAAAPEQPLPAAAPPGAEDDKPRSAFGPNAREKPVPAPKPAAAKPEAPRVAAAKPASGVAKGWAVQLGVFGSRDNAERLAKQVRGSGFPVLVNETSGKDGKKLYWVRVGPEAEQAGAVALSAKLKAAGHRDARVVAYP